MYISNLLFQTPVLDIIRHINKNLKTIAQQLKLSVSLNLSNARDCYAGMDAKKTFKINAVLVKIFKIPSLYTTDF